MDNQQTEPPIENVTNLINDIGETILNDREPIETSTDIDIAAIQESIDKNIEEINSESIEIPTNKNEECKKNVDDKCIKLPEILDCESETHTETDKITIETDNESEKKSENIENNDAINMELLHCNEILVSDESKDTIKTNTINQSDDEDCDDVDLDPSLLCPEVSMDIEDSTLIANENATDTNSLDDTINTPFIDEITGVEITFDLTKEELELRGRIYDKKNPIQFIKIHCTACHVHLGSALDGQTNRFVHPLLKVLICKNCYYFYMSGEFERDSDGSELYCRWCGQGGQVICCTNCECVFCKKCIRYNFNRTKLKHVKTAENWLCFRCDPKQLISLRIMCAELFEYVRRETQRASTLNDPSFMSEDHCTCCKPQIIDMMDDQKPNHQYSESNHHPPILPNIIRKETVNLVKNPVNFVPPLILNNAVSPGGRQFILSPIQTVMQPLLTVGTLTPTNNQPMMATSTPKATPTILPLIKSKPSTSNNTTTNGSILSSYLVTTIPNLVENEWFDKTVRATTRINNNLTAALNQLTKTQADAHTVEALAGIHNKLQELLSNSINSFIQIRKNLRNDFLAGIKCKRIQPKKMAIDRNTIANDRSELNGVGTNNNDDDDDVIVVGSPSHTATIASTSKLQKPRKILAKNSGKFQRKKFKMVTKFVPVTNLSECITIPDDDDKLADKMVINEKPSISTTIPSVEITKMVDKPEIIDTSISLNGSNENKRKSIYNIKDEPPLKIKKMMCVQVNVQRHDFSKFLKTNGSTDVH